MTASALAVRLAADLPGAVEQNVTLDRFTTYRLGGPAAIFVELATEDDLERVAGVLATADAEVLVVGRGSNLVVSDEGWPGVVLHLGKGFTKIAEIDGGIRAGGATALPVLANWCARRGLAGLEFAIAIPGSVGGAVRMNAGAHGREISDALTAVAIVDVAAGARVERPAASLELAYRHSNLTDPDVVVHADFHVDQGDPATVRERLESYRRHRAETQPGAAQNAGSVFRNPPGDHAGRLVEAAGLKGFRVGGASVSDLHANFFIAERGARAQDVFDLVHEVRTRVRARSGVDLQPEIRFVGRFEQRVGEPSP
jgi:UDP-N-acetylmuramate dehydrogenase